MDNSRVKTALQRRDYVKQESSVARHTIFHMASFTTIFKDLR